MHPTRLTVAESRGRRAVPRGAVLTTEADRPFVGLLAFSLPTDNRPGQSVSVRQNGRRVAL